MIMLLQYTLYGLPALYCGSEFLTDGLQRNPDEDTGAKPLLKLSDHKDAYVRDEITHLHCLLGRAAQQFPELFFGYYQEMMLSEKQFIYARVLRKKEIITALNCGDRPLRLEIPLAGHANRAVDVLDAGIDWEKEPKAGLDLSGCTELPIKDHTLLLELPANDGKLIRITGE